MGVQTALDAVRDAPTILDAMRRADDLAFEAGRDPGVRTLRVLGRALAGDDQITAIAAVHALAGLYDAQAARMLSALLSDSRPSVREHAAWALGAGLPRIEAIGRLIGAVAAGGFTGMIAQRTLELWSEAAGDTLAVSLEAALLGVVEAPARARLVETLGLVRGPIATRPLLAIALDAGESDDARVAAVAALGQRPRDLDEISRPLGTLVTGGGRLADAARLALSDLEPAARIAPVGEGLTVAQLFLHADIDPDLASAGAGDNGGIATLLVRLGDALVADAGGEVRRVLTLSRGQVPTAATAAAATDLHETGGQGAGHVYGHVPLAAVPVPSAAAWPLRVTARRGIRRNLRAAGRVELLHLRMADVGSLAASDVARELGIPVVFTVAPDPHTVIRSLDLAGELTRENFGDVDLREHFWFRTRLVRSLASGAAHTVLFPRPQLADDMRQLVGIDVTAHPERHTIVAEGVDLDVIDRALAETAAHVGGGQASPALDELAGLLDELAPERRGLPLIVSLGRLHRVKGMATLVEAWAGGDLRDRANLLIIGGDLQSPSLDEREQIDRIDAAVPADDRAAAGLILAGHRPNDVAACWLAAVRSGLPERAAAGGVYVCASVKEEFGIAILEAMAAGLVVVAPDGGGPATYVAHERTGMLTATWDRGQLEAAVRAALEVAAVADPSRVDEARALVRDKFTIQAMAAALGPVYRDVVRDEVELVHEAGILG